MERVAAFVDAGYFWVQCSHVLYSAKRPRQDIKLDLEAMREEFLAVLHKEFPHCSVLRIYWYDGLGENGVPTQNHKKICALDDFKIRYGTRNAQGQQKGVDGLLMADLIALAQNRGISNALIMSGDGDLAPGVAAAQSLGIRVHRLEMGGKVATSPTLRAEVDRNIVWEHKAIERFASRVQPTLVAPSPQCAHDAAPAPLVAAEQGCPAEQSVGEEHTDMAHNAIAEPIIADTPPSDEENSNPLDEIANNFCAELNSEERLTIANEPSIPRALDSRLLYLARRSLLRYLEDAEKNELRALVKRVASQS